MSDQITSASAPVSRVPAGVRTGGQFSTGRQPEPVLTRGHSVAADLDDTDQLNKHAQNALTAARARVEDLAKRRADLDLRLKSIVSTSTDPAYREAVDTIRSSFDELTTVQGLLRTEYSRLYRDNGARMSRLLADDSLAAASSDRPETVGIMAMRVKHRGVDAAESQAAADAAVNDMRVQDFEAHQRDAHARMTAAMATRDRLAQEHFDNDEERLNLVREHYAVDAAQPEAAHAFKRADEHAAQTEKLTVRSDSALIIDPLRFRDFVATQSPGGHMNLLVWRRGTKSPHDGEWLQATGFRTSPGNVTQGAILTLEDGSEAHWDRSVSSRTSFSSGVVAVIEDAPHSRNLGREDGWLGLVATIDSSD